MCSHEILVFSAVWRGLKHAKQDCAVLWFICSYEMHELQVAFDPYTSCVADNVGHSSIPVDLGSDEDLQPSSLSSSDMFKKSSLFFLDFV